MSVAFDEARAAAARGEVPVGAAIVKDGRVVASAGNRPRELRDPLAHAEMLAIRRTCEALDDERLSGCDLYVTLEPCTMCAAAARASSKATLMGSGFTGSSGSRSALSVNRFAP